MNNVSMNIITGARDSSDQYDQYFVRVQFTAGLSQRIGPVVMATAASCSAAGNPVACRSDAGQSEPNT